MKGMKIFYFIIFMPFMVIITHPHISAFHSSFSPIYPYYSNNYAYLKYGFWGMARLVALRCIAAGVTGG